jgi:O-antigen/teichoic acid export membrane protein
MRALPRAIRNSLHFLFSNVLGFAMGLVASVVMARSLGPNDLGIFHQAQWFAGTISVVLSLGFMTSATKFTAQYRAEGRTLDLVHSIRYIYRVELIIGIISTLGLLIFATPISDHYFSPAQTPIFILAFLAITPGLQTAVLSSAMEGAQIFRYQSVQALTLTPLSLVAKVLLLINGYGLKGLFWANLIFAILNLLFYHWAIGREGLLNFPPQAIAVKKGPWKQELLKYTRSMIGIHFVDLLVWSRSENYFLGRFCKAADIAYYNLAQNLLLRFTGILPNLMWKILLPLTSEHHGNEDNPKLKRTYTLALRYAACISFPIITTCYLTAYELIVIFYGHAYSEAKTCFQILCFGALITSLAQPSSAALYATNRHHFIFRFGSILAVFNIFLNFWCIPRFGAAGAATSYALTTALGAGGGFVYTWKTMGFGMPFLSFFKCGASTLVLALVVLVVVRLPVGPFDIFAHFRMYLELHTGHDAEILFGARTLRVLLAIIFGVIGYGISLLFIARPHADDLLILESMRAYFPNYLVDYIKRHAKNRMLPSPYPTVD